MADSQLADVDDVALDAFFNRIQKPRLCDLSGHAVGAFSVSQYQNEESTMTQNELNRAVADVTGETISEIRSHGFSLLASLPEERWPVFSHRGRRRRGQRRRNQRRGRQQGKERHREPVYSETE